MVANSAPKDLRGSAFGIFNLLRGLVLLAASVIAGLLWDQVGPQATFGFASVLAILTVVALRPNAVARLRRRPDGRFARVRASGPVCLEMSFVNLKWSEWIS